MTIPCTLKDALAINPGDKIHVSFDDIFSGANETIYTGIIEGYDKQGNLVLVKTLDHYIDAKTDAAVAEVYINDITGENIYHYSTIQREEGLYSTFAASDFLQDGYRKDLFQTILPELTSKERFHDITIEAYLNWLETGMSFFTPTQQNLDDMLGEDDGIEEEDIDRHQQGQHPQEPDYEGFEGQSENPEENYPEEDEIESLERLTPENRLHWLKQEYDALAGTHNLITYIRNNYPVELNNNRFYHPKTVGDIVNKFARHEMDAKSIASFTEFNPTVVEPFAMLIDNYLFAHKDKLTRL